MVIGVTGGIASGKSTVVSFFKEWGAEVINVDKLGWQVLESNQQKVVNMFGNEILRDGRRFNLKIDRKKLGKLVFADPDKKSKFDALIHPSLIKELRKQVSSIKHQVSSLVVVDCALIYEWGIEDWFDKIILVTASYETKLTRLLKLGYTKEEAENRIQAQLPDEARPADWVIKNDADLDSLRKRAETIWKTILA